MNRSTECPLSLPMNNPNPEDSPYSAFIEVFWDQRLDILRGKGVQIQDAVNWQADRIAWNLRHRLTLASC